MKFVLDSSVAIKSVLPEIDTPQAVRIRNEFRNGRHELLAPDVFPVEVSHALTKAERRGLIRPTSAIKRKTEPVRSRYSRA
jgi:predicted nucleic acid-binding protein